MSNPFFDYPEQDSGNSSGALVFLPDWGASQWSALMQQASIRRFHAGETLVRRGDIDRSLMIVTRGAIEVLIPQGRKGELVAVAVLATGSVAGEQAFLDNLVRSADLVAREEGEAVVVGVDAFDVFAGRHPELAREFLRDLARILSVKLRQANDIISGKV